MMEVSSSESRESTKNEFTLKISIFPRQFLPREEHAELLPVHHEAEEWRIELCLRSTPADLEHSVREHQE
jgi:hypothetical protein